MHGQKLIAFGKINTTVSVTILERFFAYRANQLHFGKATFIQNEVLVFTTTFIVLFGFL